MKRLERANGYFETYDPTTGRRVEGETRSCVHCGFVWIYNPKDSFDRKLAGNPTIRGKCMKCHGLTCAQAECERGGCRPLMKQIEEIEKKTAAGIILI